MKPEIAGVFEKASHGFHYDINTKHRHTHHVNEDGHELRHDTSMRTYACIEYIPVIT